MGSSLGSEKPVSAAGDLPSSKSRPAADILAIAESPSENVLKPLAVEDFHSNPNDLIFHTWAFCKAKRSRDLFVRSDHEEAKRREGMQWRERKSFVELDCGEDSFFVSRDLKAMGVADGVGGWSSLGVDPSEFSNALMASAKAFADAEASHSADPLQILSAAHRRVLEEGHVKAGSSTACIATLQTGPEGNPLLDVANLGDSGLVVSRGGEQVFRVHENTHAFNTPYQLAVLPRGFQRREAISDTARDAVRESFPIQENDVVIMGTDGLFDNSFSEHIAQDAAAIAPHHPSAMSSRGKGAGDPPPHASVLSHVPLIGSWLHHTLRDQPLAYADPYRVAQRLVMDADRNAHNSSSFTPWAALLQQHGRTNAKGGKPDDITVLLARVGRRGADVPRW